MKKITTIALVLTSLYTANAYAYLDAGTGGMLIQLLLGGIAVVGAFVKIYWLKIKAFAKKLFSKENTTPKTDTQADKPNCKTNIE